MATYGEGADGKEKVEDIYLSKRDNDERGEAR
jgi:hypothetical protein